MKTNLFIVIIFILFLTVFISPCVYAQYQVYEYDGSSVTALTDGSYNVWNPQISDNGDVVWMGKPDGNDYEIFLYNHATGTSSQLTDNSFDDSYPEVYPYNSVAINAVGQVVWSGQSGIYIYDGTAVKPLSNDGGHNPQINNNGQVVWEAGSDIFLYDGLSTSQLSSTWQHDYNPRINSNGDVVWHEFVDGYMNSEVFLYDNIAKTTTRLTDNFNTDLDPQINDAGYVAWEGWLNEDPNDREAFLYNGIEVRQLTHDSSGTSIVRINNNGVLVGAAAPNYAISLYDYNSDGLINQLASGRYNDAYPQLNDMGQVVWCGGGGSSPYFDIFFYDGVNISQITNNGSRNLYPDINNNGNFVWVSDFESGGSGGGGGGSSPVTEPATLSLLGLGLLGLVFKKRRTV